MEVLGIGKKRLLGTSFYNIIYPADVLRFVTATKELFVKESCQTPYYRLIGCQNTVRFYYCYSLLTICTSFDLFEVVWVQTEATTLNLTSKGRKGSYFLCVHSVLGVQSQFESATVTTPTSLSATKLTAQFDGHQKQLKNERIVNVKEEPMDEQEFDTVSIFLVLCCFSARICFKMR